MNITQNKHSNYFMNMLLYLIVHKHQLIFQHYYFTYFNITTLPIKNTMSLFDKLTITYMLVTPKHFTIFITYRFEPLISDIENRW